jgi:hypothetical protein
MCCKWIYILFGFSNQIFTFPIQEPVEYLKISDYLPEYPKGDQSNVRTPIIVHNHHCNLEVLYFINRPDYFVGFMARKAIEKFPIYGPGMNLL